MKTLSILLVLIGSAFLCIGFLPARRIWRNVGHELRSKWLVILILMIFFLVGYLVFDVVLFFNLPLPLELLTSSVFLGGAVFVFIIITLSQNTISSQLKAEENIKLINESLEQRVSERTKELKRLFDFNRVVLDGIADSICIIDVESFQIVDANLAFIKETELPKEQIIGRTCYEVTHKISSPCTPPHDSCPLVETISSENHAASLHIHRALSGENRYVEILTSPIRDEQGKIVQVVHIQRDVTERMLLEEHLKTSEENYRNFTGLTSDYVYRCYRTGAAPFRLRWIGGSVESISGYSVEEIMKMGCWLPIVHPDDREALASHLLWLTPGDQQQREFRIISKDGQTRWISETALCKVAKEEGEIELFGSAKDITERRQAEETLRESEEKYRNLFNNAEVGIYRTMLDGSEILDANQKYLDIVGKSREETIGKPSATNWADPKEREEMVRMLVADGHVSGFEYKKLNSQDGSIRNCLTSVVLYREEGVLEGTILDISERKHAEEEKERLEDQLLQSQKMEAVGRLAGGVAHDFNNMLGVILGHSDLALMEMEPSQPVYASLTEIRTAAERSAALTRQLLAFARKQTIAPKVIDLNETVTGMLKMLQRLIGENINLTLQTAANLWPLKVDPSQIDQMLANLCVNARDAITDVGKITIETGNCSFDARYCATHTYVEPGEYVRLVVNDNGGGMDKETLAHIFEPFFTTKGVGKGTGLGLATVYGIVKQNNGFIDVYSEPGQDTTFVIYLPRHLAENGEVANKGVAEPLLRGSEVILLVEDEPSILVTTLMMLEGLGYEVLSAATTGDAIRLFNEHTGRIQLLMTDIVMPDMNGRDLADNLLVINPKLKSLFMSGYTADVIARHGVLEEGVKFIQKPFSLVDLAVKVREVLDSK